MQNMLGIDCLKYMAAKVWIIALNNIKNIMDIEILKIVLENGSQLTVLASCDSTFFYCIIKNAKMPES